MALSQTKKAQIFLFFAILILCNANTDSERLISSLIAEESASSRGYLNASKLQIANNLLNENQRLVNDDWLISQTMIIENTTITLNQNLIIEEGGNLTLRNVTLYLNSSSEEQYRIEVCSGGHLAIEKASKVAAVGHLNPCILKASPDSSLILKDSSFGYANDEGWGYEAHGIWVQSAEAQIINCTIHDTFPTFEYGNAGIFLDRADNCLIANSTISHSVAPIDLYESSYCTLVGNNLTNSFLIYVMNSSYNTIAHNIMSGIILESSSYSFIYNNTSARDADLDVNQGIELWNSSHSIISNNIVMNTTYYGSVKNPKGPAVRVETSTNCTIRNNTLANVQIHGIAIGNCSNCLIEGNTITNSGCFDPYPATGMKRYGEYFDGIHLSYSSDIIVRNNTITKSDRNGIYDYYSISTSILNNSIGQNRGRGIKLLGSRCCIISDNSIADNNSPGIDLDAEYSQPCEGGIISYNHIMNSRNSGILVTNYNHVEINRNTIMNSGNDGVGIWWSENIIVRGNNIVDSHDYGIRIDRSDLCAVRDNIISQSGIYGILVSHSDDCDLSNNTISDSGKKAIHFEKSPGFSNLLVVGSFMTCILYGRMLLKKKRQR